MWRLSLWVVVVSALLLGGTAQAQDYFDITSPDDTIIGIPSDDDSASPAAEQPYCAIDDDEGTKYLCFKASFIEDEDGTGSGSGFCVTPSQAEYVVKALNFFAANDTPDRDPITFILSGSNTSIDGPYTVIATGTIDDFNGDTDWARNTWITGPIEIANMAAYAHYKLMFPELRNYDAANSMQIGEVEFLSDGSTGGIATDPVPRKEATEIARDIVLDWTSGSYAVSHDVYFGTSFDDVNSASRDNPLDVLVSQGQTDSSYDPDGLLEYGQTYYWRVDEVNAAPDNTIFTGEVWSFTTELFAYPVEDIIATSNVGDVNAPSTTVDGSGLNELDQHSTDSDDMWMVTLETDETVSLQYEFNRVYKLYQMLAWNYNVDFEYLLGIGLKDVTVEYSVDGVEWTTLGDVVFGQGTSKADYAANTTVEFNGVAAKYVKLTANSTFSGSNRYGLSEVRFLYLPVQTREPQPADGATDVDPVAGLAWRAGREAVSHEVYVSADEAAVADGSALIDVISENSYAGNAVQFGQTYFWKVNEVNEAEAVSVWEGDIWSFTATEFNLIEGFEDYTDAEGEEIFSTWIDGESNETGSLVGYWEAPFAEQEIVKSGNQSMPLQYDNGDSPYYSEAECNFGSLDLTAAGATSLRLFVYGDADNDAATIYVALEDSTGKVATVTYDEPAATQIEAWQKCQIPFSSFSGVNLARIETMYIGVGDRNNPSSGGTGTIFVDDIGFGTSAFTYLTQGDVISAGDTILGVPNDANWPAAETPAEAIDNTSSTKFLHRAGGSEPTGIQVTPAVGATVVTEVTFTSANDAEDRDPTSFELYGSNDGIDGPYTLIASGDIVDFAQETEWERLTKTETPITFDNSVAYKHYQLLFPTIRGDADAFMQIAEIELIGVLAQ